MEKKRSWPNLGYYSWHSPERIEKYHGDPQLDPQLGQSMSQPRFKHVSSQMCYHLTHSLSLQRVQTLPHNSVALY
jgi:hypothetical protein